MKRTIKDFQMACERKNIKFWLIHNCSICNYPCGYHITQGTVTYNSGCDCTGSDVHELRNWEEILEYYSNQTNEDIIKKMDEFFGFNETEEIAKFEKSWDSITKCYVIPLHPMTPHGRRYMAIREDGYELTRHFCSNDHFAVDIDCRIEGMEMEFVDPETVAGRDIIKMLKALRNAY